MALPVLNSDQKFTVRDQEVKIAKIKDNIVRLQDQIRNFQAQIQQLQQAAQNEIGVLRKIIEDIATAANLKLDEVQFDLDTLAFKDAPKPNEPNETPAPVPKSSKKAKAAAPAATPAA